MHRVSPYQTQGHTYSETQFPENTANNIGCLYQDYQVRHIGLSKNTDLYLFYLYLLMLNYLAYCQTSNLKGL